jgi:DNA modification methylase
MKHIHPFPARMAPEIAMSKLSELKFGQRVLDPMSGSGMVLSIASRRNIEAIGVDLDPLARLISMVGASRICEGDVRLQLERLLGAASTSNAWDLSLPWVDQDPETAKFIQYWFARKQIAQLRTLAFHLICHPMVKSRKVRNVLLVALSRLIITKEPKASLARDTAHSRPHRTITDNDFDVYNELPKSLDHVLKALRTNDIEVDAKSLLGDARRLNRVQSGSIDAVITSPPYLNAIDYMRGHKMSLVWFGYRIAELRQIRSVAIGSERGNKRPADSEFLDIAADLKLTELEPKFTKMLERYFGDLCLQLAETSRVLKGNGIATYVIGNSALRGKSIANNELVKRAARLSGLKLDSEIVRDIPDNRRYLPISQSGGGALSKRMRTEHVISFSKNVRA